MSRVRLLVVLAHTGCGAIDAVHAAGDHPLHDHLKALQEHMKDLHDEVIRTHAQHTSEVLNYLTELNARQQAQHLIDDSAVIRAALARHEIEVVCAVYDMHSGVVRFISRTPG